MEKRICVIINPISGGIDKEAIATALERRLTGCEIVYTKHPHHAIQLAKEAVEKGTKIVVTVGGDGSVNEVGQALIGTDTALAIIPTGSGNGLARHLHIPLNISAAIDVICQGHVETIDTVQINDRCYLGVAGVGFDADISFAFAQSHKRGALSYLLLVLKTLPYYKLSTYNLCIDGQEISKRAFLLSFANSSQFGNGAAIAPQADISDGYLDVVIMKNIPPHALLKAAYQLFSRSLHRSKYVEHYRCKEITLTAPHIKAHIDGEPIFFHDRIHVQIVPSSLKVLVP